MPINELTNLISHSFLESLTQNYFQGSPTSENTNAENEPQVLLQYIIAIFNDIGINANGLDSLNTPELRQQLQLALKLKRLHKHQEFLFHLKLAQDSELLRHDQEKLYQAISNTLYPEKNKNLLLLNDTFKPVTSLVSPTCLNLYLSFKQKITYVTEYVSNQLSTFFSSNATSKLAISRPLLFKYQPGEFNKPTPFMPTPKSVDSTYICRFGI